MNAHARPFVVVKPGSAQAALVKRKTKWLDEMQLAARIRTQPDNIAGIGWYFRLKQ